MDVKNKNRIGYKKTKVGWIPDDWNISSGKEASSKIAKGSSPKWQGFDYQSDGVLFVTSENVRDGFLDTSVPKFLPLEFNKKQKNSILEYGDILINIVGASIGRVCKFTEKHRLANVNQAVCVLRCHPSVSDDFVLAYFQNSGAISRLISSQVESARPNISLSDVRQFPLPLPPLLEQQAIAGVLECWDKAIRNFEKKIEKKWNIKRGLMQGLLSGKQRLPGFSGEWEEIAFGEVFEFLKSYAFSREQLTLEPQNSAGIYNIHYGDIHATYKGYVLDLEKERAVPLIKKTMELPLNLVLLREGDLIIADASEDYEGVGACVELRNMGRRKVTGGLHTFIARDKGDFSALGFRSYLLKCPAFAKRMKKISTGVSVHGISKGNLSKEKISLPPLLEQKAIAAVLSAADSEIEAMERKLAILKDQKKFLLNNLVTGTIRLPPFRDRITSNITDGDQK